MINYLPSQAEYELILKEYEKVKDYLEVFTDRIDDSTFYLGKISGMTQTIEILKASGVEVPDEFYDTLAILQMHSIGQIAKLIGNKGYEDVLKVFRSPLLAKKDFIC